MKKIILAALAATLFPAAAARADVPAGTETVTAGDVTATLAWEAGEFSPAHTALTITRQGVVAFQRPVPRLCGDGGCEIDTQDSDDFQVVDLDHDGEAEVYAHSSDNGRCCATIAIYAYDPATGSYTEFGHTWSDGPVDLESVDGHGPREIVARDDRFDSVIHSSYRIVPPRVFHFERAGGVPRLVDVTRRFRSVIRSDASGSKSFLADIKKGDDLVGFSQGLAVSYVADEYLLGRGRVGVRELDHQIARGILGQPRAARSFRHRLLRALSRIGYR
jgi:hypothetical protein